MAEELVAGIDIGSLYTKVVVLSRRMAVVYSHVRASGYSYNVTAEECLSEAIGKIGTTPPRIGRIVTTGYGRKTANLGDSEVTEIMCHALGANELLEDVGTVVDIGGQDSKVIILGDHGQVVRFVMNDRCAAGTGRFLEVMAGTLGVDVAEMGKLAAAGERQLEISNMCTVFAESEIIGHIARGADRSDIALSIHRAICRRVAGMVAQTGGIKGRVAMTGGVAKNEGVVQALGEELGTDLLVPEEPQIVGALGAALVAAKQMGWR